MQQADRAHSATDALASSGNISIPSAPALTRRELVTGAGAALAGGSVALQSSCWFTHFDAETWIERWYRSGHKLGADPQGRVMFWQSCDGDEEHALRLRAELGWPQNRHAVLGHIRRNYRPVCPGSYCGWTRGAA